MSENRLDLKQLILLIKDNKDFQANLCLDEGCVIHVTDAKPLIKVINYLINYLNELTDQPLEVSLDLHREGCTLGLMALTDKNEFPPLSDRLNETLSDYQAQLNRVHEPQRYLLFKIHFQL